MAARAWSISTARSSRVEARVDKLAVAASAAGPVHPDEPGVPSPSRRRWVILPRSVDMSLKEVADVCQSSVAHVTM